MLIRKGIDFRPSRRRYFYIPAFLLLTFVVFYPMLISIYVFAPLFIGTMSYVFLEGVDREKYFAVFVAFVYFLNLEINLSLPLFFIIIICLIVYVIFYTYLKDIKRCKFCKAILVVILVNVMYAFGLYAYDFIFESNSIVFDSMLFHALLIDMIVVMML